MASAHIARTKFALEDSNKTRVRRIKSCSIVELLFADNQTSNLVLPCISGQHKYVRV